MGSPVNEPARLEYWQRKAVDFVEKVWSRHHHGYGFIGVRRVESDSWNNIRVKLGSPRDDLEKWIARFHCRNHDLYFCPNAFTRPVLQKPYALPTPYAWADIDGADPEAFDPRPTILWETSPGRFQGLWEFDRLLSPQEAEAVSKSFAYAFGADRGGWAVTKYLRVPYTFNHKPEYDLPRVRVRADAGDPIPVPIDLPAVAQQPVGEGQVDIEDGEPSKWWRSIYRRYKPKLHRRTRFLIEGKIAAPFERDRSKCIFEIVADLHRAGASAPEIAAVLWCNPYFISKYGKRLDKLHRELGSILPKLGDGR
jgi:hypothetical protein